MTVKTEQARQGDVYMRRVDKVPEGAIPEEGRVILAHGEATGHAHEVKTPGARLLAMPNGERFLELSQNSVVEHQEHNPIALEAGVYQVIRQVEYTPQGNRTVGD